MARARIEDMKNLALLAVRQWKRDQPASPALADYSGGALIHMLREFYWMPSDAHPNPLSKSIHMMWGNSSSCSTGNRLS